MKKSISAKTIAIKVIVFSIIMVISLAFANSIFMYKAETIKFDDFYKEEQPFDVLFFGSSRVYYAFQPMELWKDYGIRSYNMAQQSESLARDYWQIKNALEHNAPGLAVVDISAYYIGYQIDPEAADQKGYLHKQIDHMPLSLTKVQAILEMCPLGSRAEYLLPFILYHGRWNELYASRKSEKEAINSRKGADIRTGIEAEERPLWKENESSENALYDTYYIDRIVELCQEYNTEVLFINVPNAFPEERMASLKYISDYLNSKDIPYLNMQKEEDYLDYSHDFSDGSHFNVAGSLKVTHAFGEYFIDRYETREISSETKKAWDNLLMYYIISKESFLENAALWYEGVMQTYADDDYIIKVYASPERIISTGTYLYLPEADGIEGYQGFKVEIYRTGEETPLKVYEYE